MRTKRHLRKASIFRYARLSVLMVMGLSQFGRICNADYLTQIQNLATMPVIDIPTPHANIPPDKSVGPIVLNDRHPLLRRPDLSWMNAPLNKIYQNSHFQPIWLTANRSEKNLQDLSALLNNAGADGLNPENYDANRLKAWTECKSPDRNAPANCDVALTVFLVRYLHDLREGRVSPRDIQTSAHIAPKPSLDIAGLLLQHLSNETLTELASEFEPKNTQYQRLKEILDSLQRLASRSGLEKFKPDTALLPGDKHPQIPILRQYLIAMGELNGSNDMADQVYSNDLVTAVKKFQHESALKADGAINPATVSLINQAPTERIAQIELAMERARWIPDITDGPMILVNIPAFELWAIDSFNDPKPLKMKVIVGKAPGNQTPLLWEEMKYLEFMPYWNIPRTIFQKEILPKMAKNKDYLASQNIELVRHRLNEKQGGVSYIRARQRPGKKNPLGRVKFVFPNTADVYLHDTPGKGAFNRQRRDLSHGCVRVSEPERLAEFVLGNQKGWNKESIEQAMSAPKSRRVTLKHSVPVLFYYGTTFVDPENQLRIYPDVYGLDEQMKKLLQDTKTATAENPIPDEQLLANKTTDVTISR
ncbi:MAG: L,D-transpeptidase family protein [Gammaproteobacteria bacterium]